MFPKRLGVLGVFLIAVLFTQASPSDGAPPQPSDGIPEPQLQEVGWQSIFWGLFALALAAMTFPSALDSSFKQTSILFPARSSPVICLADSIITMIDFSYRIYHGCSIRQAAWHVRWRILQERFDGEMVLETDSLQRNPFTSMVLFLGTVIQAIKIFGFKGLTWPKVIAGIYLGSYILSAGLSLASSHSEEMIPSREVNHLSIQHWEGFMSKRTLIETLVTGVVHSILCCFAIYHMFHPDPASTNANFFISFLVSVLYIGPLVFALRFCTIPAWRSIISSVKEIKTVTHSPSIKTRIAHVLVGVLKLSAWSIFLFACALWLYFWHSIMIILTVLVNWIVNCIGFQIIALTVYILVTLAWEWVIRKELTVEERHRAFLTFLALWNLVVAVLYCTFAYDSAGTVKPTWGEMLG